MIARGIRGGPAVFAAFLGIAGVAVAVCSYHYGLTAEGRIGPGAFPAALGVVLAVLAAWLAVQAVRTAAVDDDDRSSTDDETDTDASNARKAFLVLAMLAVAVLAAPLVGLIPALTVLIFVIAFAVERVGIVGSAVLSVSCFALFYGIFELILDVPMPGPF